MTTDLNRRPGEHNESKMDVNHTKPRRPVKLIYSEKFNSKGEALRREIEMNKNNSKEKELQKIYEIIFIVSGFAFYFIFAMLINEMYLYSPFVHWIFILFFGYTGLSMLSKVGR